jgi:PAS domain S-box-containing protein/putative nucleotidyltransferase with HDIG domain
MNQLIENIRILMLEDVPSDAELEKIELQDAGLAFTSLRVDTREAFEQALDEFKPDIILADYRLPAYNGREALEYTCRTHPQIPVIMVTGALGDEAAVELLKMGARDYVLKGNLARLASAIKRALSEEISIRNRKLAEEKYLAVFNEAMDGIVLIDCATWQVVDCNPEFEKQTGRILAQLKEIKVWEILPPEQHELYRQTLLEIQKTGSGRESNFTMQKPGSEIVPIEFSAKLLNIQQQSVIQSVTRDISERLQAEYVLRRANRALKTLSAGNLELVRAASEDELLREVTKVIVEKGGYHLAVVDYAEDYLEKTITPMAWFGTDESRYWAENISWADTEYGQLPVAKAIRSGTTQICRDIASDPAFKPWRDAALAHGYVSNIALPLSGGGRTFGGLSIYASEAEAFDDEEVLMLEELANDLAYGIITLRARVEHEQHATILRQSLEQSIQIIADTVEARDPYTAGHQRRVGELAVAIAREMGLPEEQINGIHLAAIIHDLGKIHIPAEILSKPGKLSAIEYMFIKTHPQAGYDILKDVKFPWPIADIIFQHHERLDGSGYPQGLKSDQILLESKIIGVADVVEAMLSHRPYRPALRSEAAMDEIKRGRGSAYDPVIVDICLRLLIDKGFQFSSDNAFNLR